MTDWYYTRTDGSSTQFIEDTTTADGWAHTAGVAAGEVNLDEIKTDKIIGKTDENNEIIFGLDGDGFGSATSVQIKPDLVVANQHYGGVQGGLLWTHNQEQTISINDAPQNETTCKISQRETNGRHSCLFLNNYTVDGLGHLNLPSLIIDHENAGVQDFIKMTTDDDSIKCRILDDGSIQSGKIGSQTNSGNDCNIQFKSPNNDIECFGKTLTFTATDDLVAEFKKGAGIGTKIKITGGGSTVHTNSIYELTPNALWTTRRIDMDHTLSDMRLLSSSLLLETKVGHKIEFNDGAAAHAPVNPLIHNQEFFQPGTGHIQCYVKGYRFQVQPNKNKTQWWEVNRYTNHPNWHNATLTHKSHHSSINDNEINTVNTIGRIVEYSGNPSNILYEHAGDESITASHSATWKRDTIEDRHSALSEITWTSSEESPRVAGVITQNGVLSTDTFHAISGGFTTSHIPHVDGKNGVKYAFSGDHYIWAVAEYETTYYYNLDEFTATSGAATITFSAYSGIHGHTWVATFDTGPVRWFQETSVNTWDYYLTENGTSTEFFTLDDAFVNDRFIYSGGSFWQAAGDFTLESSGVSNKDYSTGDLISSSSLNGFAHKQPDNNPSNYTIGKYIGPDFSFNDSSTYDARFTHGIVSDGGVDYVKILLPCHIHI